MFEFLGDIVSGGWGAIDNVAKAAGGVIEPFTSPFFPTPQKTTTKSQIVEPVGNIGLTFRPTSPDAPSTIETAAYQAMDWLGSPYEPVLSIPAKRYESQELAEKISSTVQEKTLGQGIAGIFETIGSGLTEAAKIKTVVDEFLWEFGIKKRETVEGTPRAGYPEGRDETHLDTGGVTGADVVSIIKGAGSYFLDQVKGLFNLGYESPTGSQPAFSIKHELKPTTGTTVGIIAIVGILILVFILGRGK